MLETGGKGLLEVLASVVADWGLDTPMEEGHRSQRDSSEERDGASEPPLEIRSLRKSHLVVLGHLVFVQGFAMLLASCLAFSLLEQSLHGLMGLYYTQSHTSAIRNASGFSIPEESTLRKLTIVFAHSDSFL